MAIFLLLYVFFMLAWLAWSLMLTYLIVKHPLPDKYGLIYLFAYWGVMILIIFVSIIFISRADWTTVPPLFKSLSS